MNCMQQVRVVCSRATTFSSPTARPTCTTCVGGLGIDPNKPSPLLCTPRYLGERLTSTSVNCSRGLLFTLPCDALMDGVPSKLWTLGPLFLSMCVYHAGSECEEGCGSPWCTTAHSYVRDCECHPIFEHACEHESAATISRQEREDEGPRVHHEYAAPA
ncbi:hypothetical protein EI94DRAFT_1733275 [Lactarius quietus]|nr:hypothetical protein EI94DRAFT_1733275 [Lactarius quietus]